MGELKDIKDTSPNDLLVSQLEKLLKKAKSGDLRSMIWICEWNNASVNHGWGVDARASERLMIAEMVMLQHNFVDNLGLIEEDSVLAQQFNFD